MLRKVLTVIFPILILAGCITAPHNTFSHDFKEIKMIVSSRPPSIETFLTPGPMEVDITYDFEIPLSTKEKVNTDLYIPRQDSKAPLLIIQHGNRSSKDFHSNQAYLAATWGVNVMTVSQPNQGQWIQNGDNLGNLVRLLYKWPTLLDQKFDKEKIILAGHSFGGSAVAIATGGGAPVKGIIFLDPALVHQKVENFLKLINVPAVILGADMKVFKSRKRESFYKKPPNHVIEISFNNATHNDAQYPNMFSWRQTLGIDYSPEESRQRQFAAGIVASIYSLCESDNNEFLIQAAKDKKTFAIKDLRFKE